MPPSSDAADAYGARVDALGRASALDPVATLEHGSQPGQQLHVYAPPQPASKPLPVLVFFHGGAWVSGGLSWLRFMAPAVTALPALFVAGTYRLAPGSRWPAAYDDVCATLALVHARIARHGGDPARLVVGGHSSGGHLAAMAVLERRATPVAACFPVSSSFDLRYGDVPDDSAEGRVYRYLFERREQDAQASPVLHLQGNTVPFHVCWGEHDFERISRTSRALVAAMHGAGMAVTQHVVPRATHFDTHLRLADPADPWYQRLHEEMHRHG
jgi:acetyl esterase/lipase